MIKQKLSDTFDLGSFILTAAKVNFEIIPYTAVLEISEEQTLEELIAIKKFNVPIGEIALSAAFPFTQRTSLNEEIKPYLVQFLKLAYSNVTYFEETLRLRRPHAVFLSHGIYATWGGVAHLCKQNGIDFVCYDRAKTINTVNFNKGQPAPDWEIGRAWDEFRNYELSCKQSEWVEKELASRGLQANQIFNYNFTRPHNSVPAIKARFGISEHSKVVTFYSNLIWDAANVSRDIIFENFEECIRSTVENLKDENLFLILRPHPAELVLGTEEPYAKKFSQEITAGNLHIADTSFNSFDILKITDVNIVNTSFVGLELLCLESKSLLFLILIIEERLYQRS